MTAEDDFSSILGYRLRALHFKGTEIFFLTAEDDFSSILGYRLRALNFKVLKFSYLTAEDDFSSVLGYRLRALHFKGTGIFFDTWILSFALCCISTKTDGFVL